MTNQQAEEILDDYLLGRITEHQCIQALMPLARYSARRLASRISPYPEGSFLLKELTAEAYFVLVEAVKNLPENHLKPIAYLRKTLSKQLLKYRIENRVIRTPERSAFRYHYDNLRGTVPLDEAQHFINRGANFETEIFEWRDAIVKTREDKIVLYQRLMGSTVAEIAKMLGQSTRTVNRTIQRLAERILAIRKMERSNGKPC